MDGLVQIFVKMTQAGIQAGAAVLVVLICRRLFWEKQPRNFCCMLWVLVFLRFLCPVTWNVALPVPQVVSQLADPWRESWQAWQQDFAVQTSTEGMSSRDSAVQERNSGGAGKEADAAGKGANAAGKEADASGSLADMTGKGADASGSLADTTGKEADAFGSRTDAAGNGSDMSGSGVNAAENAEGAAAPGLEQSGFRQNGQELQAARRRLLMQGFALLWLLGTATLLTIAAIRYLRLKHKLRFAVRDVFHGQKVWETDQITSPFVMGIFRPEIYLPAGLSETEKYHIVAHERAHIERRDPLIKMLCYLGTICQWMNPFAWIAFYFYNQDMEMACDERALKGFEQRERLDYSRTLLMTAARGSGLELPVFFGESNAKRRVENILQKKKRTIAGCCLAAVLICGLAVLLFTQNGKEGGSESAASGPAEGAEASVDNPEVQAENDAEAGKVEAYPFVEDGKLKVMLYNFTGWNHMYVNQVDFRVERKTGESWEVVEPDLSVNRITSQPKLYRVQWPRELGGLLAQYEKKLEDGDYRLVLYCQDTPVEDANTASEEIYAPFSWKDEAPADAEDMQARLDAAQQRYQSSEASEGVSFFYAEEAASREEEIQRREEEYAAITKSDQDMMRLYEEKLKQIEQRMESADAVQKEAYSAFCEELRQEMHGLEASMDNLKDTIIDGENITQNRLECEAMITQLQAELSYIEKREEIQDTLRQEIEKAEEENKQKLIDLYNDKAEFMQQLQERKLRLQQQVRELNQEINMCRMQEWTGYDCIEKQKQELAKLPEALSAQEAGNYGIPVIRANGDSSEVRDGLYNFRMEAELGDVFSETSNVEELKSGEIEQNGEPVLYSRVKTMTFTFGEETEEGDLILTAVTAWNGGYLILVDRSRDRMRDSGTEEMAVYCYDHLHWLTAPGNNFEVVTASDEWSLTFKQWEEHLISSKLDGTVDRMDIAVFLKQE